MLRVLTLNLLHDASSWPDRAPLVESQLLALAPDIALLQEIAWPDEQVTTLAAALGRRTGHPYSVRVTPVIVPGRWQGALAVLSRFPVVAAEEPNVPGPVHVCQRVRLDVNGSLLDVYNLHLDPYSAYARRTALAAILSRMGRYPDASSVVLQRPSQVLSGVAGLWV